MAFSIAFSMAFSRLSPHGFRYINIIVVLHFFYVGRTIAHIALGVDWGRSFLPLCVGRVFAGLSDAACGWRRVVGDRLRGSDRRGGSRWRDSFAAACRGTVEEVRR